MKKAVLIMMVAGLLGFVGIGSALADVSLELSGTPSGSLYGVYTSPYSISINSGSSVPMICDDFSTEISVGHTWDAIATNGSVALTSSNISTDTKFGSFIGMKGYEEIFYLVEVLQTESLSSDEKEAISWAIWDVGATGNNNTINDIDTMIQNNGGNASTFLSISNTSDASAGYWIKQAEDGYGTVNLSEFTIYEPNPTTSSQEFIRFQVPEPNSLIFLGFSLLMVAGAVTLKVRKAHA